MSTHPAALAQVDATQRANLSALAGYLDAMGEGSLHFRMAEYGFWRFEEGADNMRLAIGDPWTLRMCFEPEPEHPTACACAVGWASLSGLLPFLECEDWAGYELRVLGVSRWEEKEEGGYRMRTALDPLRMTWEDLFGPANPDSPAQAARRIREFLS